MGLLCPVGRQEAQARGTPLWGRSGLGLLLPAFLLLAGRGALGKHSTDQKEMGLVRGLLYLSLADFGSSLCLEALFIDLTLVGWQLCFISSDPEQPWDSPCLWSQVVWGRAEGRKEFLFIIVQILEFF